MNKRLLQDNNSDNRRPIGRVNSKADVAEVQMNNDETRNVTHINNNNRVIETSDAEMYIRVKVIIKVVVVDDIVRSEVNHHVTVEDSHATIQRIVKSRDTSVVIWTVVTINTFINKTIRIVVVPSSPDVALAVTKLLPRPSYLLAST